MKEITTELALRIRRDRGLLLPVEGEGSLDVHYTNREVAAIAQRQAEIMKEIQQLDNRLLEISR